MFQSLHFVFFSFLTVHTFASQNLPRQLPADRPPIHPTYFNTSTSTPSPSPWSASSPSLYTPSSSPTSSAQNSSSIPWQPPSPLSHPNAPTAPSGGTSLLSTSTGTSATVTPSSQTSPLIPSAPFAPSSAGSSLSQWSTPPAPSNATNPSIPSAIPLATAPSPTSDLPVPPRPGNWSLPIGGKNDSRFLVSPNAGGPSAPMTAGPQVTGTLPGLVNHTAVRLQPGTVQGSSRPAMLLTGPVTLVYDRNGTAVVQNNVTLTYLPPLPTNGSSMGTGRPAPGKPGRPPKSAPHGQKPSPNQGKVPGGGDDDDGDGWDIGDIGGSKEHDHNGNPFVSDPRPSRVVNPEGLLSIVSANDVTGVLESATPTSMSAAPTDFQGVQSTVPPPATNGAGPTSFNNQPGSQAPPPATPAPGATSSPGLGNFGDVASPTPTQPRPQTQVAPHKLVTSDSAPGPQAPAVTAPLSINPNSPLFPESVSALSPALNVVGPSIGSPSQSAPINAGNPAPAPSVTPGPGRANSPVSNPASGPGANPAPAPGSNPAPAPGSNPAPTHESNPAPVPAPGSNPAPVPAPGSSQGSPQGPPQRPSPSTTPLNNFQNDAGISFAAAPIPSNGPANAVSAPTFKPPSNPSTGAPGATNNAPAPGIAGAGPPAPNPVSSGDPAPTTDVAPIQVSAAPDVLSSIQAPVISVNGGAPPPTPAAGQGPIISVNPVAPVANAPGAGSPGAAPTQPSIAGSAPPSNPGSQQAPAAPDQPAAGTGNPTNPGSAPPVVSAVNVGPQVIQAQAPPVAISGHVVSLDASGVLSVDGRPSTTVPAPAQPSGPGAASLANPGQASTPGAPGVSVAPGTSNGQIPDSPFKFAPAGSPQAENTIGGSAPVIPGQSQASGGTVSMAAPGQNVPTVGPIPSASLTFAPQAAPSALNLGGQTVHAGAAPSTVSGHAFSLDTSGVLFVDGHASTNVAASGTVAASAIPTAQLSLSQQPVSTLEVKGQTLKAGSAAATASGHTFSLNTAGSLLVDGTPTEVPATQTSAPVPSAPITFTPGTAPSPAATAINLGGSTIQAGVAGLVMSGHAVSLDKSGVLYVDNAPSTVLKASASTAIPTATFEPPSSQSSGAVSPSKPTAAVSHVQVGSQTLTAGAAAITTASHTLSLAPSGILYVDGTPSSVLKPQSTAGVPSALISSFKPTASVPAANINGESVYAGAKPRTIEGHTVSLDTSGVLRVDGTPSTTLRASSGSAAPTTQMTFSTSPKPSASSSSSPGSAFGPAGGSGPGGGGSDGGPKNWQSSASSSGAPRLGLQASMLSGVLAMLGTAMLL